MACCSPTFTPLWPPSGRAETAGGSPGPCVRRGSHTWPPGGPAGPKSRSFGLRQAGNGLGMRNLDVQRPKPLLASQPHDLTRGGARQ